MAATPEGGSAAFARVEFRIVGPGDAGKLADIFAELDSPFFGPHPLTPDEATRLANRSGRDVYALLVADQLPVAYGMLRGWDEGYTTPSLGIAVRTSAKGRGYGRLMMERLHDEARARGADRVRLRVHPDNTVARRLYESFGYVDQGEERGERLMILQLEDPEAR